MRIPLLRFGRDESPFAWWEFLFAPVLLPLYAMVLFFVVGLTILVVPFLMFAAWRSERRFARSMRDQGRFMTWKELEPLLRAGDGTLIVEQAQKDGVRVWWSRDDVLREASMKPPAEADLDYMRSGKPHPFVAWCFARYLSRDAGGATLTRPPYSYPPGFVEAAFFEERFPTLRVVMTVMPSATGAERGRW
jgi:hypothetical protein